MPTNRLLHISSTTSPRHSTVLCGVAAHFKANNARGQAFGTCLFMLALGIFTLVSLFVM